MPGLRTSPFARTPHPPLSLPPLSRSAAYPLSVKADDLQTQGGGETHGCRYAHGWRDTRLHVRELGGCEKGRGTLAVVHTLLQSARLSFAATLLQVCNIKGFAA